jgi:DNA-binding YbaB/EbfC family protein
MQELQVEATSGGGMVTVVVNGSKQILSIRIDPEVVSKDDVEMLQDLILAAVNDAQRKADEELQKSMGGMLGEKSLECSKCKSWKCYLSAKLEVLSAKWSGKWEVGSEHSARSTEHLALSTSLALRTWHFALHLALRHFTCTSHF